MSTEIISQFQQFYKRPPTHKSVAPGRVNIIGEHTDYNNGFVLPVALQFSAKVFASKRNDSIVEVRSMQYPNDLEVFDISKPISTGQLGWGNYVRGVAKEFIDRGLKLTGCNILLTSDVPQGCGLSSSAALEVAVGGLFNKLGQHNLSNLQIAEIGQAAENNFIDCKCGIMDQLISAKGITGHAIKIDCLNLATEAVSIPDSQVIMIINSNYPRKLAESEYNMRRVACETAAKAMNVESLRFANMEMLEEVRETVDNEVFRRAKHIISENNRVVAVIDALKNDDMTTFYSLMQEAHLSLVNDFQITVDATEFIVDMCMDAANGEAGVRQTGGGFGGAVVCVCSTDKVKLIKSAINDYYPQKSGLRADIYICEASDGLLVENI